VSDSQSIFAQSYFIYFLRRYSSTIWRPVRVAFKTATASIPSGSKTPYTVKIIRRFKHVYERNPSKQLYPKLLKAKEANAANLAIQEHRNQGPIDVIQVEKKKRQRGKRSSLTGKETVAGQ
jgi:hypothetical protein